AREPTGALGRQALDVTPNRVDEHHFADALEYSPAAGTLILRSIHRLPHDLADPCTAARSGQMHEPRQCRNQRIERPQVATEKTARDIGWRVRSRRSVRKLSR